MPALSTPLPLQAFQATGFGSSSLAAVLAEAHAAFDPRIGTLDLTLLRTLALRRERLAAGGFALAADDVGPICHGGAVLVHTKPDLRAGETLLSGAVTVDPVGGGHEFLNDHIALAVRPDGVRHSARGLLAGLTRHPKAKQFVSEFTVLAFAAAQAIRDGDVAALAAAVNAYRDGFDAWQSGEYLGPVRATADELARRLPGDVAGWKPPGAGGCESLVVVCRSRAGRDRVLDSFSSLGWWAGPARVARGVQLGRVGGRWEVSAGFRVDLVGAADLGQDVALGEAGTCCSFAIEPRQTRPIRPPVLPSE